MKARTFEAFPKTYGIVHPAEQWASERGIRRSPMHAQEQALGAAFYEAVGWERPQWYEANAPLVEQLRRRAARGRVGCPLVVADHQRRASRDARARRHLRPLRVRDLRRLRGRRARRAAARGDGADGRAGRPGRLHAGAEPGRRLQVRPHDHAARRPGVPRRHRRRPRHGRPQAVRRRAARRRLGVARRRDDGVDDDRALGAAGARHPRERHLRRRLARGLPVRPLPHDRDRLAARARLADLVRRRPRLGALRADRAGRAAVGRALGGGRAALARPPAGSASTGRPAGSRRATAPTAPSSRPSTTSSRPGWSGRT